MKPIIRIENLSKRYRLGGERLPYATVRESVAAALKAPFRRRHRVGGSPAEDSFWALKGVNLEVRPGEVVGLIGRNGAGKSTLLKILSRVTEPTTGLVDLYGRVGSLLEVGTGFHPELTGRENIFLNGAILGMKRAETARKFDEIVAFADVSRFLDMPIKRYSSGMVMRLAFAVAAHLEPEVLIVDEVLAVGDAAFQKKCLGKMEAVAHQGRTILFVSHSMPVLRQLCTRGVLLRQGAVQRTGPIEDVIGEYLGEVDSTNEISFERPGGTAAHFTRLCVRDARGDKSSRLPHSEPFVTEIEFVVHETLTADRLWWNLARTDGVDVMGSVELDQTVECRTRGPGRYLATVRFPGGILNEGTYQYRVGLGSAAGRLRDYKYGTFFDVYDDTDYGAINTGGRRDGVVLLRLAWDETRLD